MLIIGVLSSAFVIAPVLKVLNLKYGVGVPMDATQEWLKAHPTPLAAPQATLMASVSKGVFMGGLPWAMVGLGACIAVCIIAIDLVSKGQGMLLPRARPGRGRGLYLPFSLSAPILAGGLVAYLRGAPPKQGGEEQPRRTCLTRLKEAEAEGDKRGLLFASGLITGEALMGILLAVPITLAGIWPFFKGDFMAIFKPNPPLGGWPGLVVVSVVVYALYRVVMNPTRRALEVR